MKTITKLLAILTLSFTITACDEGLTERERECMELTQDAQHCISRANRHDRYSQDRYDTQRLDRYNEPVYQNQPLMTDQQMYQQYPQMNLDNGFDSGDMLLAAAGGALLSGYAVHKMKNGKYGYKDKSGKFISHSEYKNRLMQSDNDKLKSKMRQSETKHKAELDKLRNKHKADLANQKKQLKNNQSTKDRLKAKQLDLKQSGVTSKDKAKSRFGNMNNIEKKAKDNKLKAQQQSKNNDLKQRLQQKRKAQGKPTRKTSSYKSSSRSSTKSKRRRG